MYNLLVSSGLPVGVGRWHIKKAGQLKPAKNNYKLKLRKKNMN